MNHPELQQKTFLLLLLTVSAAFVYVISPFFGSVFWGIVLAIVFAPINKRLLHAMPGRKNLSAFLTLILCLVIVILPLTLISGALLRQATSIYQKMSTGDLNFGAYFQQIVGALPDWMVRVLQRFGLADFAAVQNAITSGMTEGSKFIAAQAVTIGQNTFDFVIGLGIMLYLLFFLMRDGMMLNGRIKQALPMSAQNSHYLFDKFTTVIRATFKGNLIVAAAQGALGGILFFFMGIGGALLWGVLMAFLSLLPAIGAALVWAPVAIYLLATGAILKGLLMIAFGVLVIGLVDNILRPMLVGKDTRLPDYIVLLSTVGGMAIFGLSGFVIGPMIAALFVASWTIFIQRKDVVADGPTDQPGR